MLKLSLAGALAGSILAVLTWTRPGASPKPAEPADGGPVTIQVLNNGFHTDLVAPRHALEARGGPLAQAVRSLAPGEWVAIGWGDATFYVDQSPISDRLPDGARAFFRAGNPAVLMLDPEVRDPGLAYGQTERVALRLPPEAFDRLAGRIEASLDLSGGGPRVAAARPGDDARFFASRETFSILHLCNHWTAGVLNAGGVTIRPARSVFSGEVMRAARAAELDTAAPRA